MKIKNKGKVYPSPSSASSSSSSSSSAIPCHSDGDFLSVLKLLPAAILALASVLSLEDREVLAYMITRSMKTTTPSPITQDSKRKPPKRAPNNHNKNSNNNSNATNNTHKPPMFECDCFDCYTSYWFKWDSSPNRELIHQAIEAFEDHLAHGEKSKKVNGRGKRRDKLTRRVPDKPSSDDVSETPLPEIEESFDFAEEKDVKVVVTADDDVEERDTEKYEDEEYEEEDKEDKKEEEVVTVRTMVAATTNNNHHKGLARKVLPDVLGLFNSRLWNLWGPNV